MRTVWGRSLQRHGTKECRLQPARRPLVVSVQAGKKKKGGGGGGGGKGRQDSNGTATIKSAGKPREGASYAQETRNIILSVTNATKTAPTGKEILNNVSFGMYLGAKIGVLGVNGSGKSSLLRILAKEDEEFKGDYQLAPSVRVGYLPQEPKLDDSATVLQNIEPAVQPVRDMLKEFEEVSMQMADAADVDSLMSKMDRLQTQLDAIDGWEIDRQLERALDALRCPPSDQIAKTLSGGERRRVAIARLVLERPQIILMDEPTNHLDTESVAWLENFLRDFPGTVVSVTHDRYFLDNVAGWIYELDRGKGQEFEGNYNEWLAAKNARLQGEAKNQSDLKKQIAAELEWVQSNAKGQQKKGKARMRAYEDLVQQADAYRTSGSLDTITIPQPPRLGDKVIELSNVTKSQGDRLLINDLTVSIPPGAVVGIIGGNGAGKSTLFRMIMGLDKPDSGKIEVGETARLMFVDQDREALQNDERSLIDALGGEGEEMDLGGRSIKVRQYASWFNFKGADQQKQVKNLSGGERNRLHLASVLRQSGNVLLLDEPTNDLDVDTLRALESAILNFAGTSLIISHDRYFLDRVCTHILAYEGDSEVRWFEGSYSEYEADWKQRTGKKDPSRVKFRKLASATMS